MEPTGLRRATTASVVALAMLMTGSGSHTLVPSVPALEVSNGLVLPEGAEPEPIPAVRAVIETLAHHPVVMLGESHNLAEAGRFYSQLARDDEFASMADAIVVEFGNARFQRVVDRFISGGEVKRSRLRRVWQDTTQVAGWDAPMYRRLFHAVRAGNADRRPAERIRMLLADPPIDWSRVSSESEVRPFLLRRESFMARVIEREVLRQDGRAVVIAGLAHVERSVEPPDTPNVTQLLDERHPGAVWVVGVHLGFPDGEWQQAISRWPIPSIAALEGTWIGMLPKAAGLAQDALNAMLYVGAPDALHLSVPLPSIYAAEDYWRTLKDRWPYGVGGSFSARAAYSAFLDAGYPGRFSRREIDAAYRFAQCIRDHAVEAFPDPQLQYDSVGFYGASIEEARNDPEYPTAFEACGRGFGP